MTVCMVKWTVTSCWHWRLHSSRRRCNCHWTSHLALADRPPPTCAATFPGFPFLLVFFLFHEYPLRVVSVVFSLATQNSLAVTVVKFFGVSPVFFSGVLCLVAHPSLLLFSFSLIVAPGAGTFACGRSRFWCDDNTLGPVPSFSVSARRSIRRGRPWPWRANVLGFCGNSCAAFVFFFRRGPCC